VEGLTFRRATPADTERIAEIMHGEPLGEVVGLSGGDRRLAARFGKEMVRMPGSPQGWQGTVIAELAGEAVGILQAGSDSVSFSLTPPLALRAIQVFGLVNAVKLLPRVRARGRLNMTPPAGAYRVHELHVDPRYRNRGIGGQMLDYAEEDARRLGHRVMSLNTTTTNPARRLYERHGFRIVETRTDPAFERYTGIAGRHLMVKDLGSSTECKI
jgi:ribosomal protein S18 acetylase RimI-like enzyme